jgi:hypothetical protein
VRQDLRAEDELQAGAHRETENKEKEKTPLRGFMFCISTARKNVEIFD